MNAKTANQMITLQQWLLNELSERQMSTREFSRFSNVAHTVLNQIISGGMVEGKYPSVATLVRLSQATNTDICALIAMVAPEQTLSDAQAMTLVSRIQRLSPEGRAIIEDWLMGRLLKGSNKDK